MSTGTLRIAGVVPAAGTSSRMGTPKALLDAGGRSFVASAVASLAQGGCDPVVVVVGPGHHEAARRASEAGAQVLVNDDPGEGPITSVRLALSSLAGSVDAIALLPVDHPTVASSTVVALIRALCDSRAPLALPVFQGRRGHPTLFARELFPALLDPKLDGGARTVVHARLDDAALVEVDDPGVVTDVDTPEAYQAAFGAGRDA